MEIDTSQLEALLRQQEQQALSRSKAPGKGSDFGNILARQLGGEGTAALDAPDMSKGAAQAGMISQMLLGEVGQAEALDPDMAVLEAAFSQASGALDMWDAYAKTLGADAGTASLREAYAMLEGIDGQVSRLKQDTAAVRGKNSGLDSLLNELEVMTATEKFKFNRGDYNT